MEAIIATERTTMIIVVVRREGPLRGVRIESATVIPYNPSLN
jgi:hypothetical protein